MVHFTLSFIGLDEDGEWDVAVRETECLLPVLWVDALEKWQDVGGTKACFRQTKHTREVQQRAPESHT